MARKRAAKGRRGGGSGPDRATEVMTAVRLLIAIWELVQDAFRDGRWPGGGPGRPR
jgi:hypothetical protein